MREHGSEHSSEHGSEHSGEYGGEHRFYRELILEENRNPRNCGRLDGADCERCCRNPLCGDEITIYLKLDEKKEKIVDVRFVGRGCAISQAAASLFTDHIKGRTVREVAAMDEQEIRKLLGINLNPMRMKCAVLVLKTTVEALETLKCPHGETVPCPGCLLHRHDKQWNEDGREEVGQ